MEQNVKKFWQQFIEKNNISSDIPAAWMFGDGTKAMGDELGNLVVEGKKTATCSAQKIYEIERENMPTVGQYDIILNGDSEPIAITQITHIDLVKMKDVSEQFARTEGEGDLSYDYWYNEHMKFFTWAFSQYNESFTPEEILVCVTFEVVDMYDK